MGLLRFIMRCYAFYIHITWMDGWMDDGDDNGDRRTRISLALYRVVLA